MLDPVSPDGRPRRSTAIVVGLPAMATGDELKTFVSIWHIVKG
jgi:hypothetical protein